MNLIDLIIVIVYMLVLVYIGFKAGKENKTQEDYFLGGRSIATIPIALSIAATTTSASSFIGGPGWSYSSGLIAYMVNFSVPLVLAIALTIFIPFFYNLKITSIYEYVEMRLGWKSRILASLSFLTSNVIQVSSFFYIPSIIIQQFTGWPLTLTVPIVVLISILYTIIGGIKAVILTDAIQMVVLFGGLIVAFLILLNNLNIGFFEALGQAKSAGKLDALDFSLDLSLENGFWVVLIGGTFLWLKYYATDQNQVQRIITAKSVKEVKKSICISGFVINIISLAFMIFGVLLSIYYTGETFENDNDVMITFIASEIPVGVLGLIISGIFAAAMSSIDSVLNTVTTVFIKDYYERYFSKGKEASLKVSMIFTTVFGIVLIFFTLLTFGDTADSILSVLVDYLSYFAGSLLAIFVLAMFTKRASDNGVVFGFITGILSVVLISIYSDIDPMWGYAVGFLITVIVGYTVSIIINESQKEGVEEFTYKGQRTKLIKERKEFEKDGSSILPGRLDRYGYIMLGFFFFQILFLGLIQML